MLPRPPLLPQQQQQQQEHDAFSAKSPRPAGVAENTSQDYSYSASVSCVI
jgi:hypothetical protein